MHRYTVVRSVLEVGAPCTTWLSAAYVYMIEASLGLHVVSHPSVTYASHNRGDLMKCQAFLLVLVSAVALPTAALAQTSSTAPAPNIRAVPATTTAIRPGDAVEITVWRKPELSGEFFVASDGSIAHPFYQDVKVGGISVEAATQRVQAFLEQFETSPRVRVDPIYRVSVSGEVRQPKLYRLRPENTVLDAILEAGGPSERGRSGRVRLYRDGAATVLSMDGAGASAGEVLVQSGDRIVVERRLNVFVDVIRPTISFVGSVASLTYAWRRFTR